MPCQGDSRFGPTIDRRVFAGLFGLSAAAALVGCSGNDPSGHSTDTDGRAFKIGVIGPLTGDSASYGISVARGAKLAARDFQDDERTYEIRAEDDIADSETSVNAFNALYDWGMQALVGPTTTGAALAVSSEAYEARIFMLTPSATSEEVTSGKDNVYQVCFTDPAQGKNSALFISNHFPGEKIAVFYRNDDSYSQGIATAFLEQAKVSGLDIVKSELTFTEDTQSDFKVQLTSARSSGATMIFAPIYYTPASVLLTQAHEMGFSVRVFGVDGMDGILSVENFDARLAEGVCLLTPFSADDARSAEFVNAFRKEFDAVPDQFAADAYDAVHAIHEALAHADIDADASAEDVCDSLRVAMTEIEVDGLTGKLTWKSSGQVSKEPTAYVVRDGAYVAVE
ncbi:amino acid/amide ABC transporter substrate-binding protein, HAAT family [Coriobacterium glomerans PW2]|uniref:Amino acid/amide ABC transporter substrate-binding protein, HAAT family n=1 Tax=Coriobacterium glomerans (strain ATCC 49209 / DSM 20642 / JCM 10262 / PW2) TaxID=700015 RepID=F2NBI1_CORGP|nr:ABC transporter substrate-binding protein [Coriobacterium glomerans]AEB06717.1 amino acid/amide ABC transporter substrate-binding protein, HAAT family [Coriobacterium glomerans PW2]